MNDTIIFLSTVLSALLLWLPRRWAPLPLLAGVLFITAQQQSQILGLNFPAIRILIAAGLVRLMVRGERISGKLNPVDRMIILWALWNLSSSAFHRPGALVFHLGIVFNFLGSYLLFRVFICGPEQIRGIYRMTCLLLMPIAAMMLAEKALGVNPLGLFGIGTVDVPITNEHNRAVGAFGHPILAGTIGAVSVPMAVALWRREALLAAVSLCACLAIVFASGSTGPILAGTAAILSLALWPLRGHLRAIRWTLLIAIVLLHLVMSDPVYFLMARIDITGGSTGYFRAQLIRSAIGHLNEWWLTGTDYTRHWMPSGIIANPDHTDITNYYLQMGIWGGLPLMFLFISVLVRVFRRVGQALRAAADSPREEQFLVWTVGAVMVGHATTFMSISYFDQSVVILCLALACTGALPVTRMAGVLANARQTAPELMPS